MRLLEAVLATNRRFVAGDRPIRLGEEWRSTPPLIGITCIDPRLTALLPGALGMNDEQFIWLRNAGNIVIDPMGTTLRSLALACALKGGREIAIIGHTDCKAAQTNMLDLLASFAELGVKREALPANLTEFFGCCASERQNVLRAVEIVRQSPLIGAKVPIHGLVVDVVTGAIEWLVNGYTQEANAALSVTPSPEPAAAVPPPLVPEIPMHAVPPDFKLALPPKLPRRSARLRYS